MMNMKLQTVALWAIGLVPLTILAVGMAWGASKEYQAWQDIQPILSEVFLPKKLSESGFDSATSERERMSAAENQERELLAEIFSSLKAEAMRDEISGPLGQWVLVAPKTPWDEAPLYARLAKKAMPAINRLEKMNNQSQAHASLTALNPNTFRDVNQVLQIAIMDAFYRSDFDDAYRLFTLLGKQVASIPINVDASTQSDALREQFIFYALIQDSLQYDSWTPKQLEGLAKLIEDPVDLKQRLQAGLRHQNSRIIGNTVLAYDNRILLEAQDGDYPWHPTYGAVYLKNLLQAANSSSTISGINDYSQINPAVQMETQSVSSGGVFSPAFVHYRGNSAAVLNDIKNLAIAIHEAENLRRMTATAIEIKRYQKRNGRWPSDLSALQKEYQNSLPTSMISGAAFEYFAFDSPPETHAFLQSTGDGVFNVQNTIADWPRPNGYRGARFGGNLNRAFMIR